jgi:hypothetical protein
MQSNPIQIHVATNGSDSWSGKLAEPDKAANDGPLASLEGARLAVRKLVRDNRPTGTIEVLIQAGTYPIQRTVVFELEDSGCERLSITYRSASEAAKPVFTAGVEIVDWHRCASLPQHMPTNPDVELWEATVPDGVPSFSIIYEDGIPLKRARAKGFTPTVSGHWQDEECWRLGSRTQLHFPKGAMRRYENIEDVEIVIRPWCLWTMNILPLADVDEENNIATTAVEGTYFLTRERYHRFPDETVWVENIPEGMLHPGNWLLNSRQRKLYLLTRKGARPGRVTVPTLRELIRVEGEIDEQGDTDTPVSSFVIRKPDLRRGRPRQMELITTRACNTTGKCGMRAMHCCASGGLKTVGWPTAPLAPQVVPESDSTCTHVTIASRAATLPIWAAREFSSAVMVPD